MKSKKLLSLLLSLAMAISLAAPAFAAEEETATTPAYTVPADVAGKLVILHTNDTHGADVAVEGTSFGTAGVAALKKDFEAAGAQVLLLSAGDATQGTPLVNYGKGAEAIKFMNAAGYDAMAPGNHEFDWGAENLVNAVADAQFPILAANILKEDGTTLFEANKIFELDGLKVGVFGLDTPEAATKTNPEKVAGLDFLATEDLYACAQAQVDELKAAGCDVVVALGHLGVDEETASAFNRSSDLVNHVTGIDLFVDGHSHTEMKDGKPVNPDTYPTFENNSDTLIVSTGTKLANVGVVVYDAEAKTWTPSLVNAAEYTKVDEDVAALVAETEATVDEALKGVIGKTEVELDGVKNNVRTGETNLGDFATDAILWFAKKDQGDHVVAAITNGGGIRDSIPAGDITYKTMNTVFPFGNTVATLDLTGLQVLETLEAATFCTPASIGAFPQVAGITFSIDTTAEYENGEPYSTYFRCANPGTRIQDVTIGGEPLDLEKTYTIATNDFSAVGGDTFYAFKDAKSTMKDTGTPLDQALADYANEVLGGTITAEQYGAPAGRITVKYTDVAADAWYTDAVKEIISYGLMSTVNGKDFAPSATVTRATVFQMLWNTYGQPAAEEPASFTDVEGKWYAASAAWAEDVGLTTGDGTGAYAGDRAVTRAELATILTRYAEYAGLRGATADYTTFADAADVADWAADGMSFAVGTKIITGKPGNLLDPNGTAIRAELAQMMINLWDNVTPIYQAWSQDIEVPETDGIPAHTIKAIVTMPTWEHEKPYTAVVMLHGTGSNKDEAGNGYIAAASYMAQCGIASIRFDFMGNGDSEASYTDYNYTSAKIDAKAAADYLTSLEDVSDEKVAVMGWSQGGTDALLAAAAYPETFKAVVTWAGALDLSTMFEDFDAAYKTAQKDGYYEMTFDWRDPLHVGPQWFKEVKSTDVLKEAAKIKAPILSIHGSLDDTVPMSDSESVAALADKNLLYVVDGADHTYNVFAETDFATLTKAIEAGIGFLDNTLEGSVAGIASAVSKYGNVTTYIPKTCFDGAGFEVGDILNITVGETTIQAPYGTGYSNVDVGSPIVLADKNGTIEVAINMGNFAGTYGVAVDETLISFSMAEKAGYLEEYTIRNIDALRTNVREDYESDEVFANFRNVTIGDIADGVLYRSSSPVNPELGRNTYADALIKDTGVKTVINLADSQEGMEAYEGYADTYYSTLNVIPLNMGVDFTAEDFNAKLKTGLEYMLANEGPYLIHCTEGKDRAGFVNTLLAAAMGATQDEIVDDYMISFENYYHVEKGSERWNAIADKNVILNLVKIAGVEDTAALEGTDLKAAAETYLTDTVGLTAEQVKGLQAVLAGGTFEPAYKEFRVTVMNGERAIPAIVTMPAGEGKFPAVVINHGHGGSKDENVGFIGVAAALAEQGVASIRMDFPGCGESTEPFTENYLTNMISDSNVCKDYLLANYDVDADKLGILGYSMGGRIASTIVGEEGNPYQALVLLAGANGAGDALAYQLGGGEENYETAYETAKTEGKYTITTIYGQVQDLSQNWFDDMMASDPLANAASFTGPVLVIHGDVDDVVPDAVNKLSLEAYQNATEVIVPGADHGYGFYSDQPDVTELVETSISDFFAGNLK